MMIEEDTEKFRKMINEGKFKQESYDKLLKRFELNNIDLEAEYTKIVKKESNLSRRKRDLVPDFLAVRDMLIEKKKHDEENKEVPVSAAINVDKIIEEKTNNL